MPHPEDTPPPGLQHSLSLRHGPRTNPRPIGQTGMGPLHWPPTTSLPGSSQTPSESPPSPITPSSFHNSASTPADWDFGPPDMCNPRFHAYIHHLHPTCNQRNLPQQTPQQCPSTPHHRRTLLNHCQPTLHHPKMVPSHSPKHWRIILPTNHPPNRPHPMLPYHPLTPFPLRTRTPKKTLYWHRHCGDI